MRKQRRENGREKKYAGIKPALKSVGFLILIVLGVAVLALGRGRILETRIYEVPDRVSREEKSGGSRNVDSAVRIVGLADLHGCMIGKDQSRLVRRVRESNPDIIVYLGDMVDRTRPSESAEALIVLNRQLVDIAPVYYVDGNHEDDVRSSEPDVYERLNEELTGAGAVHLNNAFAKVNVLRDSPEEDERNSGEGKTVNICGVSTHYYWSEEERKLIEEFREKDGVNVLICHYPESVMWYDAFDDGSLDVAMSGHTHGGLVVVPFKGGMYAPEQGWWPRYFQGAYKIFDDTSWRQYGGGEGAEYLGTMVISAGLAGEHGVPRVNNPMEISVVNIR